ncbi:MAG: DUF2750 domain-containing protein [Bacteroidota bacterium]
MEISSKEIAAVSMLSPFERYNYTIKRIVDWERLFTIRGDEGWAILYVDDRPVYSLWPSEQIATATNAGIIDGSIISEISLDVFLNTVIPELKDKGILINVFPVDNKSGFVVEIDEIVRDIAEEEANY